jgi:hypothetical protein
MATRIIDNPDGSKTVPLVRPIKGHEGDISSITLKPPGYRDFMELGDPTAIIVTPQVGFPQDDMAAIRGYVERLANVAPPLLVQCSLPDSLALRDAVKGFFTAASAANSTSPPTS